MGGGRGSASTAHDRKARHDRRANPLHTGRPRGACAAGRNHLAGGRAPRHGAAASLLRAGARLPRRRQLPRLHGRDRGRTGTGPVLPAPSRGRDDREQRGRPAGARPAHGAGVAAGGPAGGGPRPRFALRPLDCRCRARSRPAACARGAAGGCEPSGHGGQSRRLHPLQSLRARLPGSAGQRRHRHGRARRGNADRLRFRRPDGRLDLRGLRRVRAGLPDGCAHAENGARRAAAGPPGGQRLPLLRRRLPDHLLDKRRPAGFGRGPRRPGQ